MRSVKRPLIKAHMTPFPHGIARTAPLLDARRMMLDLHVRHLPVMDAGELVGLVTDRDLKLLLGPEFDYPDPRELTVADAMVEDAYVVDMDEPLDVVLHHMAEHRIGATLVTRQGKLAGIFTATDACRQFAELLVEIHGPDPEGHSAA